MNVPNVAHDNRIERDADYCSRQYNCLENVINITHVLKNKTWFQTRRYHVRFVFQLISEVMISNTLLLSSSSSSSSSSSASSPSSSSLSSSSSSSSLSSWWWQWWVCFDTDFDHESRTNYGKKVGRLTSRTCRTLFMTIELEGLLIMVHDSIIV